ncbi:MAG: hypothetical protein ACYDDF_09910 [Thermoplasmatota archaeon]
MREFFVVVPRASVSDWKSYLAAHGLPTRPRKRIGPVVRLVIEERLPEVAWRDGEPVISLRATRRLIREHPGLFEGAEEQLDGGPHKQ